MKQISTLLLALALPICASATVLMPKSGIITKSPVKSLIAVEASDFATNAVAKEDAADVTIKCTGEYSFEYYAESGESVWDIAKKYNTAASSVAAENELEQEIISAPCMLLIPIV